MAAARPFFMRTFLELFDRHFSDLNDRARRLINQTPEELLYRKPREIPATFQMFSIGEYILRSAASMEQTFGGLTTRLWDDPFEWTLPEKLNSTRLVLDYFDEVEESRIRSFAFFRADSDLLKQVPAPEKLTPVFE